MWTVSSNGGPDRSSYALLDAGRNLAAKCCLTFSAPFRIMTFPSVGEHQMAIVNNPDPFLATLVARILASVPGTRRILLFGSRAKGLARPDSDYDLLVVAELSEAPAARARLVRRALRDLGVGLDIVVVTPAEYEKLKGYRSGVVAWADREGAVLHEAA